MMKDLEAQFLLYEIFFLRNDQRTRTKQNRRSSVVGGLHTRRAGSYMNVQSSLERKIFYF